MSGGYFDYKDEYFLSEVFTYAVQAVPFYRRQETKVARLRNPLEDKVISELLYDLVCLVKTYDYYKCGDIDDKKYFDDVSAFKDKWLKGIKANKEYCKNLIEQEIENLKSELLQTFEISDTGKN